MCISIKSRFVYFRSYYFRYSITPRLVNQNYSLFFSFHVSLKECSKCEKKNIISQHFAFSFDRIFCMETIFYSMWDLLASCPPLRGKRGVWQARRLILTFLMPSPAFGGLFSQSNAQHSLINYPSHAWHKIRRKLILIFSPRVKGEEHASYTHTDEKLNMRTSKELSKSRRDKHLCVKNIIYILIYVCRKN